ncbi:hypothetical protein Sa4125_31470 [Aureimonas sp. SA4125]|nr:hypothetical protein Sa4125_31470 [Aureimonas sp. SA4125]
MPGLLLDQLQQHEPKLAAVEDTLTAPLSTKSARRLVRAPAGAMRAGVPIIPATAAEGRMGVMMISKHVRSLQCILEL